MDKTIGCMIKNRRKELGFTLKELSERADISISFLSDIERGQTNPSINKLSKIAKVLSKPSSYFLEKPEINSELSDIKLEICCIINKLKNGNYTLNEQPIPECTSEVLINSFKISLALINK